MDAISEIIHDAAWALEAHALTSGIQLLGLYIRLLFCATVSRGPCGLVQIYCLCLVNSIDGERNAEKPYYVQGRELCKVENGSRIHRHDQEVRQGRDAILYTHSAINELVDNPHTFPAIQVLYKTRSTTHSSSPSPLLKRH